MGITRKWVAIAGAVLVSGALLTGAAFAAGGAGSGASSARPEKAAHAANLSPGQTELHKQLQELRKSAMEKLKADSKALIDQAVKDGKITQQEADRLLKHKGHFAKHGRKGPMHQNMTPEQLKAKLDAAVKSGRITQDQADKMLQHWTERQSK